MTTKRTSIIFALAAFVLLSGLVTPMPAEAAKTTTWNTTNVPQLAYFWNHNYPYPNYATLLAPYWGYSVGLAPNANVSVTYRVKLVDVSTGNEIRSRDAVPLGTRIRVEWLRYDSDISWFGTGGTADSPYGTWRENATDPPDYCSNYYLGSSLFGLPGYSLYIPLSIHPPAMEVSGDGVSCQGSVCTVTGQPGSKSIRATFPATYGNFYYRYYGRGAAGVGCYVNPGIPMRRCDSAYLLGLCEGSGSPTPNTQPYSLQVPTRSISFDLNAVETLGGPPEPPAIIGPSVGVVNTPYSFSFRSTDPDGDDIRYGVYWDSDNLERLPNIIVHQMFPTVGRVPSGTAQSATKVFATPGERTLWVLAEDSNTLRSSYVPHRINITAAASPTLSFGAVPAAIPRGSSTELQWSSTNADTCTAGGDWSGVKAVPFGTETRTGITTPKTYTLTCEGPGGSITRTANVSIVPSVNINAGNTTITEGESTTISWDSSDVSSCEVSGPNGFFFTETSGSESTGPLSEDSTYNIVCEGITGSASVTVDPASQRIKFEQF